MGGGGLECLDLHVVRAFRTTFTHLFFCFFCYPRFKLKWIRNFICRSRAESKVKCLLMPPVEAEF
jgi:hypothetical protein